MKNSLETRLGIFVALAVIAAVLIIETIGGIDGFKRGYRLNALFGQVQELKVGDRVKMAGVDIGAVEKIELAEDKVRVVMKIRGDAAIKTDSVARVKFAGLMGQNFVSVDFGSAGAERLKNEQYITTAEQPDFSAIMVKLDNVASNVENLTKSFTGDKIENLLGPLTDFIRQNSGQVSATLANIRNVSDKIASGEGTVGRLIYDQSLYDNVLAAMTDLQATVADARGMLAEVNTGQGTMGKLLKDETLYRETTASMTNLRQILEKINSGQGTVGKLINEPDFYKNAKLTLQKVDKATEGLEDQGPLSVLGIAVNSLF
ncbi:MAG TPA: MlaD family protein [Verrucomicrobiota bacterium]|nr:MlaD family protein [Verrucomicrobiota bacterium]